MNEGQSTAQAAGATGHSLPPPLLLHPRDAIERFALRYEVLRWAVGCIDFEDRQLFAELFNFIEALEDDVELLRETVKKWFGDSSVHLSRPLDQVLKHLDSKAHILTVRELAARIFNVRLDLEEATAYDFDIEEGGDPTVANLEHLEAAVDRARAALTVIARDLLLSVGIPPENGGGHV